MTDIDPKALALRVADSMDAYLAADGDERSLPAEFVFSDDEARALAAFLREAVRKAVAIAGEDHTGCNPQMVAMRISDILNEALSSTTAPQPGGAVKVTDEMVETALRAYFPEDAELSDAKFDERVEHIRDDMRAALTSVLSALSPSPSGWDAGAKDWRERDLDLIAAHEKVEAFKAGAQATRAYDISKIDEWGDSYYAGLLKDEPLPTPPAGEG